MINDALLVFKAILLCEKIREICPYGDFQVFSQGAKRATWAHAASRSQLAKELFELRLQDFCITDVLRSAIPRPFWLTLN